MSAPQQPASQPDKKSLGAVIIMAVVAVFFGIVVLQLLDRLTHGSLEGEPAPSLMLSRVVADGEEAAQEVLGAHPGKVVLLDFWTTWCPPCREQMPIVERLYADETLKEALVVRSVNLDEPSPDRVAKVRAYLTRAGYQTPTLIGSPRDARAYQVTSYPTLVLIDANGQVARVMTGLRSEQALREAIAQLSATPAKPQ